MKQLFYIFTLVVIFLGLITALQGCTKRGDETPACGSGPDRYYYLSEPQKQILPYSGFDTIQMANNKGDTIHCIGKGKHYGFVYALEKNANPACGNTGTSKYYETYETTYKDTVKNLSIIITHYYWHRTEDAFLSVYDDFELSFKAQFFYISDFQISNKNSRTYFGNLDLNGKVYPDVSKSIIGNKYESDTTSFMLINKHDGLIRIQLNPNEIWTILN